jgi:DNA-binding transcriptional LysR family regulator
VEWVLSPPDSYLGRLVGLGFAAHGLVPPAPTLVTLSIYMRLCLLATGRFLTVLPRQTLRHPTNRTWLRALPVDFGRTAGGIALSTLRDRHVSGAAVRRSQPAGGGRGRRYPAGGRSYCM